MFFLSVGGDIADAAAVLLRCDCGATACHDIDIDIGVDRYIRSS